MYTGDMDRILKDGTFTGSLSSLGKTTAEIYRRTLQENCELISENLSLASDQISRLGTVKKPEDLISLQKDILSENISTTIKNSQRLMHLFMENMEDLTHIFSSMRDTAVSATKSAARSAMKHAEKSEKSERHTHDKA